MHDRLFTTLRLLLFSLLLVWGGYALLVYIGMPIHQAVLIPDAVRTPIADACPGGGEFCLGLHAILPSIFFSITRAAPFVWYGIWSVVALGVLVAAQFLQYGDWRLRLSLRPITLILLFLASVWLMFTVIAAGTNADQPYVRLYEPIPQVYVSASDQALVALRENFDALQERGCLRYVGQTNNGAGTYDIKGRCVQMAFFTRVVPPMLVLFLLCFVFLTLGRALLRLLRVPIAHPLAEVVFSIGLGSAGVLVLLWLLSLLSLYTQLAGWALLLLIPAILPKDAWYWLRSFVHRRWMYEAPFYGGALLIGWLLVSYLALNYVNVVRPFPIGWDDLGKYINQARLLVSYGHFIPQLASYQWEYITSLGFLLFGYESIFGATTAMMINWMAGVFAILVTYAFGFLYLGRHRGLLAALLYYALPMVGHFSFADMKVDNAVYTFGSLTVFAIFLTLFPPARPAASDEAADEEGDEGLLPAIGGMLLAGILAGVAFSLKPTAVMVILALATVIFGVVLHWWAFIGSFFLVWALYGYEGRFNIADIAARVYGSPDALSRSVVIGACVVLGVGLLGYAIFLAPKTLRRVGTMLALFFGTMLLTVAPWLLYNNIQYGNVIPHLVFTAPNTLTPTFLIDQGGAIDYGQDIRKLPTELQVDTSQCVGTSKSEELDRYWGYHSGWGHYLELPWRSVMNSDSAGYYVTTIPALLLFPLLLLLPFFWMRRGRWLRWIFVATLFMLLQWIFFANGIPWYGIGIFLGLVVGLEALVARAPDTPSRVMAAVLVGLSLMIAFAMRFWQFETQSNIFEYAIGKVSAETMRERTIPHYDDIRETIEQRREAMPDRPYVYRIGTFIPYFIPQNLEVLPVADHQLDFFNCLYRERDARLTLKRLLALGFNSMIFDTNTHTIERDPNGSLHRKVEDFVNFVNTPGLGIGIAINDVDGGIAFILLPHELPSEEPVPSPLP